MKKWKAWLKDGLLTAAIMSAAFLLNQLLLQVFHTQTMISMLFVLGVYLVSLVTRTYFWGIGASLVSALMINYSFTYPHFSDMITPEGLSSAIIMLIVSVITGTMTTKIKRQNKMKAEAERERMRANLLRAVSHDLRTPLTAIHSACSAMLDNYDVLTDQQHRKLLEDVQTESMWLNRMVENLLSVTRLDNASVALRLQETVLDELIDALIVKFRKYYPHQAVDVILPEEFLTIPMDPTLIVQVLTNLIENAVKFADGDHRIDLIVEEQEETVTITVRDYGRGLSEAALKNLFEPINHHDGDSNHGMGLGLSICKSIIRAHGGTIEGRNIPPKGAVFIVTLPKEDTYESCQSHNSGG